MAGGVTGAGTGLTKAMQGGGSATGFVGLSGLLPSVAAWSWHLTGGFDPSRVAVVSRNEQFLCQVVVNGGWAFAFVSVSLPGIAFVSFLLAAVAGVALSLLVWVPRAGPRRRRWHQQGGWVARIGDRESRSLVVGSSRVRGLARWS